MDPENLHLLLESAASLLFAVVFAAIIIIISLNRSKRSSGKEEKGDDTGKSFFDELTEGIPDGKWVALSSDKTRLVSQADTPLEAAERARGSGETNPVVYRIFRGSRFA